MSAEAIPSEIVFELPNSLIAGTRSYEYRSNPSNANNFTTEGSVIQFTLPRLDRSFYQTNTIYVRGRLALTLLGTASADIGDPNLSFTSAGAYSLFSRQVVRTANGNTIETIQNPAILTNVQMSYGLTPAERVGMSNLVKNAPGSTIWNNLTTSAGWGMGCSAPAGHNTTMEFSIPLNSILTQCDKFLPASYDEFVIELTIANMISAAGVQNPTFIIHKDIAGVTAFTLSDLEICAQVFELSPQSHAQLMASYPAGITLKSQSYMYGSASLPAQSGASSYDLVYSHKLQSIKQLVMCCAPQNAIEGPLYAGVNPNLNTWSLSVNGQFYPQRPIRASNPSETYIQNQKAYGAMMSDLKCGSVVPEHHAIASTAYNTFHDAYLAYGVLGARDLADLPAKCNRCFFLLDLESVNGGKSLFNGISTSMSSTSSLIRLEVGAQLANSTHNIHYFSVYDCLLKFDPQLGVSVVN